MIISGTSVSAVRPFFGRSAQSQVNDILASIDSIIDVQRRMSSKTEIDQEVSNLLASA